MFANNRREKGQGLTEYGLAISLVALVIILIVTVFGAQVNELYCRITHEFSPTSDLSSACSKPIIRTLVVDRSSSTISLEALVYDPGGRTITNVEFYLDGATSPTSSDSTFEYCYGDGSAPCPPQPLGAGRHSIQVKAYNDNGDVGTRTLVLR